MSQLGNQDDLNTPFVRDDLSFGDSVTRTNANFSATSPTNMEMESDPLSECLRLTRATSGTTKLLDLPVPWRLKFAAGKTYVHIVISGTCSLHMEGSSEALTIDESEVVIIPHGNSHFLSSGIADCPARQSRGTPKVVRETSFGIQEGGNTEIISGAYTFTGIPGHPLIDVLPAVLRFGLADPSVPRWFVTAAQAISDEIKGNADGATAIVLPLMDAIFVQAVRCNLRNKAYAEGNWPAALRDPLIRAVLDRIHRDPSREWTVAELARTARVSRSTIASRFTRIVGMSPMLYVARWRLSLAARLLRDERIGVREAAERVGYTAEAAFSRAFRRQFGVPPANYRDEVLDTR